MVLAQDLRDAVLQAALQGRLTKQLDSDSSVDFILQNIEKKNHIIIDMIFEESFLKDIPDNWKYVRLGDLLFIARGGSPRPIQAYLTENDTGVNWIKIGDTEIGGKYIYSTKEKIKKEGIKKSRYVKEGDFLLTNSMSFGRPYILKTRGCIHDGWLVLSDENNCFVQDYLYWLLSSSLVFIQFSGMASGAVVKNLNIDKVRATIIPLPPVEEQQRIVDRVNELMEKIDEYEKVEKELVALEHKFPDDMKNALLRAAMQGKLTEQLDSDSSVDEMLEGEAVCLLNMNDYPYIIPENWKFAKLQELTAIQIKRGKSPKYVDNSKILVFAQKCNQKVGRISLQDAKYLDESIKNKYKEENYLKGNDIVINSTGGGTLGRIGYITEELINNSLPIVPDSHVTTIRIKKNILSKYIFFFLKFNQSYLESMGVGSTNQTELKPDTIKELLVPIPPIEEQQRIVEKMEQLLPLCETL